MIAAIYARKSNEQGIGNMNDIRRRPPLGRPTRTPAAPGARPPQEPMAQLHCQTTRTNNALSA